MNNLETIKRNLTPDVEFIINQETGDSIMLKPFNMAQQAQAATLAPKMEALKIDENNIVVDADLMNEMSRLLGSVIERSVPGISEEDVDNFVAGHLVKLMEILEKLVPQTENKIDLVKKRIEDINDKQDW